VDAALAIIDDTGVAALTIRALAERVGSSPMSLYSHFRSKDELLDLAGADVARRLFADTGNATWEAEVTSLCHQVRGLLLQHPRWLPLLSRPLPAATVPLRERLLGLMTREGIPLEEAFAAVSNAGLVAIGLSLVEITLRDADGSFSVARRFQQLKQWSEKPSFAGENPLTSAALAELGDFDANANFSAAIHIFINGLKAPRARDTLKS
jgi:AcrR family transcriptional regulator